MRQKSPTKLAVAVAFAAAIILPVFILLEQGCPTTNTVTTDTNGVTVTNTTTTLDTNKAVSAINAVVPVAVKLVIEKSPNTRQYFIDAALAISVFASTNGVDPNQLNAAIIGAAGADTLNADALSAIDAAVNLYKAFYGDALASKLNTPAWLGPVLNALSSAILNGVNPPPTQ